MAIAGKRALTDNCTDLCLLGSTPGGHRALCSREQHAGGQHVWLRSEAVMMEQRRCPQHSGFIPWLVLLLSAALLTPEAWGARSTAFRGQWSVGDLIGALVVLGILVGLVLFLVWPRQHS